MLIKYSFLFLDSQSIGEIQLSRKKNLESEGGVCVLLTQSVDEFPNNFDENVFKFRLFSILKKKSFSSYDRLNPGGEELSSRSMWRNEEEKEKVNVMSISFEKSNKR